MTQIYPGLFSINKLTGTMLIVLSVEDDLVNIIQFNESYRRPIRYERRSQAYFEFTTNHYCDQIS